MSRLCLADFDDTLILTDSLKTVMSSEHWLCSPSLFAAGGKLFFCRALHKGESGARDSFKRGMLKRYDKLSEEAVAAYVAKFKSLLNTAVIDHIKSENYDRIIVISASEEQLIRSVLEGVFDNFEVIANRVDAGEDFKTCYGAEKVRRLREYLPDLSDCDITVYTDSMSDKPIMELAGRSYLVKGESLTPVDNGGRG